MVSVSEVSKDTEDTAYLYLLHVSWTNFQPILLMVSVSKVSEDTEGTAPSCICILS